MIMKHIQWIILVLIVIFTSIANGQAQHSVYAIKNVNIIPMTEDNEIIEKATVLIAKYPSGKPHLLSNIVNRYL